jgi:hypothetical protein
MRQSIMAVAWWCAERNGGKPPAGRGEPGDESRAGNRSSPGQGGGSNKCGAVSWVWFRSEIF